MSGKSPLQKHHFDGPINGDFGSWHCGLSSHLCELNIGCLHLLQMFPMSSDRLKCRKKSSDAIFYFLNEFVMAGNCNLHNNILITTLHYIINFIFHSLLINPPCLARYCADGGRNSRTGVREGSICRHGSSE